MVEQYPHFLFVYVPGGDSVQDSSGNWVTSPGEWKFHSKCREETNGKGQQINGVDGKANVYSSTVFMPKSAGSITEGTEILVTTQKDETSPKRVKGACLKFSPGQLSTRLWV